MRIAFLTPEYPSELPDAGGLASYVHRMAHLLVSFGHEAEVFVSSEGNSETVMDRGVLLHRVNVRQNQLLTYRIARSLTYRIANAAQASSVSLLLLPWLYQAKALAAAMERRHSQAPFQLVQSADYQATGLFVRRCPERRHVVRCSVASDLYASIDRYYSRFKHMRGYLERRVMRAADFTYAPSRYLAEHFRNNYKIDVGVIRPPAYFDASEKVPLPFSLPERFFIHFGLLLDRKGTGLIAEALPLAWKTVPDLKMIWSGRCSDYEQLERWRSLWGDRDRQVLITGPLRRPQMRTVLMQADVSVLPSQVDNLPNTVIESLLLGVPVLGSRGASIDELVEEGQSGHLVHLGDVKGLADAMIKMWRFESPVVKGFNWDSKVAQEMRPDRAIAKLIELVEPRVKVGSAV